MRIVFFALAFLLGASAFFSCKKSSNGGAGGGADTSFMKATIGGLPFNTSKPGSASATISVSGGTDYEYINGLDSSGKAIQLTLINVGGPGTIAIGTGVVTAYYYSSGGFLGPSTFATNGYIVISTLTPYISGSFSFTTSDLKVVTNGVFSVKAP